MSTLFPLIWLMLSPIQAPEVFPIISLTKAWERRDGSSEPIAWGGDLILPMGIWSGMSLAHPSCRLGAGDVGGCFGRGGRVVWR